MFKLKHNNMKFINALWDTLPGIVLSGRSPEGFPIFVQPVKLQEQEVFCQNCFETIMMKDVDEHSVFCTTDN